MANFKDLPREIRSAIWAHALIDGDEAVTDADENLSDADEDLSDADEAFPNSDGQAVYFFDPEDFGIKDESEGDEAESDWEGEPEVIVAFPTIMHLCHESREYAKCHLSFREDSVTGVNVPCRPYRPKTDAFFVPHRHFDNFLNAVTNAQNDEYNGKLQEGKKAFCREIAHLAFSSRMLMDDDDVGTLAYVVSEMTALRQLSFVFGNTDALDLTRPLAEFDFTEDKAELVPGKRRTRVHVQETLDSLKEEAALWEISDEDRTPWNKWTGEWLFTFEAKTIERVRGLV